MEGDLAPKHKLEDDNALEPAVKSQKLAAEEEDDEHPHAFTRLPPEILLDIFDYLKPEDNCMKKLSEVCKKFYNLCSSRLRVLQIDFDEINTSTCLPVIRRGYTEIRMDGKEIDCNREEIAKLLEPSRETTRKLIINKGSSNESVIKMRWLMYILGSLPNLEEVEITRVNGLIPQCSRKALKDNEKPALSNLRKLTLTNIPSVICWAFDNAKNIEELKLYITSFKEQYYNAYRHLVTHQTKLRLLHLDANISYPISRKRSTAAALGGNDVEKLLCNFPKLEHIKLTAGYHRAPLLRTITQAKLIAGPPVTSLKTIELLNCNENIDIDQIRKKFPSLESFKSYDLNWSIASA